MKSQFRVVGYPRSGQHGIISWLMGNLPSPSVFLNNCTLAMPEEIWYVDGKRMPLGYHPRTTELFSCFGLEGGINLMHEERPNPHMFISREIPTVFVIRDIKNHMASIIRHSHLSLRGSNFYSVWRDYARLAVEPFTERYMTIAFSLWHASGDYCRDIFDAFNEMMGTNLKYNDATRNDVMDSGGGSSFDGVGFVGTASKMNVNERYKKVSLPPIPTELLELNEEIFGQIYE